MLLHGYTGSGAGQESYMQFEPLSDEKGFLYLHPDGTASSCLTEQFWNATDSCCNFCGDAVDDSAYLAAVIAEVQANFNVDPNRIHLIGHSNGGFMSYRMACDHADTIASIASLAGATWDDPTDCTPSEPVHALQIHGTLDGTILYGGGSITGVPYPGAVQTVETWATYDLCSLVPDTSLPPLDLDGAIPGDETTVSRYATGCTRGSAELWTIVGGGHIPVLSSTFSREVVDWLLDHPKSSVSVLPAADATWLMLALVSVGAAVVWRRNHPSG
jgi:polyhydroxybutyrate depolymerase